jgi:glucose 1-dehydrogenase
MVRYALVTGAANGIGRAIATRLAADGLCVTVVDIARENRDGAPPTDELIRGAGGQATFLQADLADPKCCADVIAAPARLDVIVNNAVLAGSHSKPLLETELSDWEAMMAVNLRAPFLLCRDAVRRMLAQEPRDEVRGRIINITSQHGMVGSPGAFTYAVGKGGLVQMTRQIAVEHGGDGILCNAVAPGKIISGAPGDLSRSEDGLAYVRSRTPFHRLGSVDDVAGAVSFLSSPDAGYISGINLLVDGGWMAY